MATTAPSPARPGTAPETALEWIAGTAAFAVEIALVVTAGVVAHRLASPGGPVAAWAGAVLGVAAVIAVWSRWMSPQADHRLDLAGRLLLGCTLVVAVALGAGLTGSTTWALLLGIGGVAVTATAQTLLR